jgi:AhpD family alkylhydroperoxidase
MLALEQRIAKSSIEKPLVELVRLRASQINGCAFCLDMHSRTLRELGESQQRLDTLAAWREVSFFDERERAALALTEAATKFGDHGVPDDVYDAAAEVFEEVELANIILAIGLINFWNRIGVTCRMEPKRRD